MKTNPVKIKNVIDLPGEEWRMIKDAPFYMVSNLGRVKAITYEKWTGKRFIHRKAHIMKQTLNAYGYLVVHLINKSGRKQVFRVNRLVAFAFLPNPLNLEQVNHLNEVKTDNRAVNLAWCSAKENANYLLHSIRISKTKGTQIRCDGHEFTSITKAAKFYKIPVSTFWAWLTNKKPMPPEWKERGLQII